MFIDSYHQDFHRFHLEFTVDNNTLLWNVLREKECWEWAESALFWLSNGIENKVSIVSVSVDEDTHENPATLRAIVRFSFAPTPLSSEGIANLVHTPFCSIVQHAPRFFSRLRICSAWYYEYDYVDQMPGKRQDIPL